jgi:uncharacterized protein (DUF302 family)
MNRRTISAGKTMSRTTRWISHAAAFATLMIVLSGGAAGAANPASLPGTVTVKTSHDFDSLVNRVEKAVANHKMGLVAQASASRGAVARGVKIPGNAVLMVFRNDYAVRMLKASVPAGIEAPLRIYITENTDGTASLTYRTPSAVFAPYRNTALDEMAKELDGIFEGIVRDAAGQ